MRYHTASVIAITVCLSVAVAAPAAAKATSSRPVTLTVAPRMVGPTSALLAAPVGSVASVADGFTSVAQNEHAGRAAMVAWAAYLRELVVQRRLSVQNERAFAAQTNQTCRGALSPITKLTTDPTGFSTALTNLGEEIGADATIAFNQSAAVPFAKLALRLSTLRWSGAASAATVRRFITAGTALLALAPSNLCADAFDVLSEGASTTAPPTTTQLLSSYTGASAAFSSGLTAFLGQLSAYGTGAERMLVLRINALTRRVNLISARAIAHGTLALKLALGVPQPSMFMRHRARSATTRTIAKPTLSKAGTTSPRRSGSAPLTVGTRTGKHRSLVL